MPAYSLARFGALRRAAAFGFALAAAGAAQDAGDFFAQNCTSCHTIGGGRLTGPDLKNVQDRKERAWLAQFVLAPRAAIDRGDPYALKLQEEARGVVMPNIAGLNPALVERLLDMIAAESKLAKSRFAGSQISGRPFTPQDVAEGRRLFTGARKLGGGAPACISCHSLAGTGLLGGGGFAPDLTKVYERLGGRPGLGSWLTAPATPTMQAVFRGKGLKPEEILPLIAAFEHSARTPAPATAAVSTPFVLLGFGGAALGLVVFNAAWRNRFRSVRRALVDTARERAR